jgi:hypothetical protein
MAHALKFFTTTLLAVVGGGLTAGCTSKTIPDWAMYRQEQARKAPRVVAVARVASLSEPLKMATDGPELELYSPEWYARERARDEALKKRYNICNGC